MRSYERFAMLLAALSIIASTLNQPAAGTPAPQQAVTVQAAAREATPELRRRTFEIVWRTIKEKHFDPHFNGVDWDKVHDLYAPRVARVKNDKEFYELLQAMLDELHQSHFVVLPPELTYKPEKKDTEEAGVGLSLRMVEDQAVVWRVLPESSAARAGLKPGFIIKEIDDQTIEQISAPARKRKESPASLRASITGFIEERFLGEPGSSVRLVYLDASDQRREVTIKREKLRGEMSPPIGSFPSLFTEFESKRLADGIGYVRFNFFHPILNQRIRAAVRSMADAPGLIIDLRGNPGGFDGVGQGLAGLLLDRQTSLGTSRMRQGYENYVVYPLKNPYPGPVVILLDCMSGSASESFSGGLQSVGRAVIVGEQSGGGDLDASIDKLPTGALLLYAYGDFVTAKGVSLEGRGVIPDVEVQLTRASLLMDRDPQLEAAVNYIRKQASR
ncbi:MAG TPA: S41 family peptidase [Pyrinomonadaceae bacterium]|nr:S41 family peptidase [Pyrinomonadaceae bacterium]